MFIEYFISFFLAILGAITGALAGIFFCGAITASIKFILKKLK